MRNALLILLIAGCSVDSATPVAPTAATGSPATSAESTVTTDTPGQAMASVPIIDLVPVILLQSGNKTISVTGIQGENCCTSANGSFTLEKTATQQRWLSPGWAHQGGTGWALTYGAPSNSVLSLKYSWYGTTFAEYQTSGSGSSGGLSLVYQANCRFPQSVTVN